MVGFGVIEMVGQLAAQDMVNRGLSFHSPDEDLINYFESIGLAKDEKGREAIHQALAEFRQMTGIQPGTEEEEPRCWVAYAVVQHEIASAREMIESALTERKPSFLADLQHQQSLKYTLKVLDEQEALLNNHFSDESQRFTVSSQDIHDLITKDRNLTCPHAEPQGFSFDSWNIGEEAAAAEEKADLGMPGNVTINPPSYGFQDPAQGKQDAAEAQADHYETDHAGYDADLDEVPF